LGLGPLSLDQLRPGPYPCPRPTQCLGPFERTFWVHGPNRALGPVGPGPSWTCTVPITEYQWDPCPRCALQIRVGCGLHISWGFHQQSNYKLAIWFGTCTILAVVQTSPALEHTFAEGKKLHGSRFGFHGSPLNKWYSIQRNGLRMFPGRSWANFKNSLSLGGSAP
jgi:hypothetical protein